MSMRTLAAVAISAVIAAAVLDGAPFAGSLRAARAADEFPRKCELVFVEETNAAFRQLAHLVFRLAYSSNELDFGEDPVACSLHELQQGVAGSFTNDPLAGVLEATMSRANGLFPYPLAVCTPRGKETATLATLEITVVEATDGDGQSINPPAEVALDTFECPTTTLPASTTVGEVTTTTLVPTTTTLPGDLCGDADDNGSVTATDALVTMRTAVGLAQCPAVRCDTNSDGQVSTSDALRILRKVVGIDQSLHCPT